MAKNVTLSRTSLPSNFFYPTALDAERVVGLIRQEKSFELAAFSIAGESLWSIRDSEWKSFTNSPFSIDSGEIWLIESHSIAVFDLEGHLDRHIQVKLGDNERIGCAAIQVDAILLSIYRYESDHSPRIVRLNRHGNEIWSTTLPISKIAYDGCQYLGVDTNWKSTPIPAWQPSSWIPFGEDQLLLSSNLILATFSEMPRSGIGCRYVLDIHTGELLWKSEASPTANAAVLSNDRFLIGDQGYGAFRTRLYENRKGIAESWTSHGHYIELPDQNVLCIETSNDQSVEQFVVKLYTDGVVVRYGRRLQGYYTSKPVCMADGRFYFWRANTLMAWSQSEALTEVAAIGVGENSYASILKFSETRFGIHVKNSNDQQTPVFAIMDFE